MTNNILNEMPIDSEEALAEWLCIAFMRLKDAEGRLIGGRIDGSHALQIAKMLVKAGVIALEEWEDD